MQIIKNLLALFSVRVLEKFSYNTYCKKDSFVFSIFYKNINKHTLLFNKQIVILTLLTEM